MIVQSCFSCFIILMIYCCSSAIIPKEFVSPSKNGLNATTFIRSFPLPYFNPRLKREVEVTDYSDANSANAAEEEEQQEHVLYVCTDEINNEIDCSCDGITLECSYGITTLYLKPMKEDFVMEKVFFSDVNIETLQKGKMFPGNQENIKNIKFHRTKTSSIEDNAFDEFNNLNWIEFDNVPFGSLDESIFTEGLGLSLKTLSLISCELTEFDPSILNNLVNLDSLSLHGNQQKNGKIKKFPASLNGLTELYLGECGLTQLDADVFENLGNLKKLYIYQNPFISIPKAFEALTTVNLLHFSGSHIENIPENSFKNMKNLEKLYLHKSHNLKSIESCAFCNLPNLKVLQLHESLELTYFNENAFDIVSSPRSTPELEEFSIHTCNISVLPENLLDWKSVTILKLNHNPYACNCSNAWLFNDLLSSNSIYESKLSDDYETSSHHKYHLGCLTPDHAETVSIALAEIFAKCSTPISTSLKWYFFVLALFIFGICISITVYANRSRLSIF